MNIGQLIAERGKPFYSFEFFPPKDPDQWPDFFKTKKASYIDWNGKR